MKTKEALKIPFYPEGFAKKGSLIGDGQTHFVLEGGNALLATRTEAEWRDNYVFQGGLHLLGWYRGRSATGVMLQDPQGHEYNMAMGEFYDLIVAKGVQPGGWVWGFWTFRKQGSYYSLIRADKPAEPPAIYGIEEEEPPVVDEIEEDG